MKTLLCFVFCLTVVVQAAPFDTRMTRRNATDTTFETFSIADPGGNRFLFWNETNNIFEWSNDGALLQSLNAANLASGTIPTARFPDSLQVVGVFTPTGATSGDETDDRAAIQTALNTAGTAAALYGGKAVVELERAGDYRAVPIQYVPTAGATKYGGLAMPNNVILRLNGSRIKFVYSGADGTNGGWIFPQGLETNTSDFGAGSFWEIHGPGRFEASDDTEERTGNGIVLSQCQGCKVLGVTIGPRLYHAFEIAAGRGHLIEDTIIEAPLNSVGHPDVQFDAFGDAGVSTNTAFTPTLLIDDVVFRRCWVRGFHPQGSGVTRRVEFGHSAGVQRNILFTDCEFDGIYGNSPGDTNTDKPIVDFNTQSSISHHVQNVTFLRCKFHHDCVGGAGTACIYVGAGSIPTAHNILVDSCYFDGNFMSAILFGSSDTSSTAGSMPGNRSNLVAKNCVAWLGVPTSGTSGGTYGPRPGATQTSNTSQTIFCGGKCASVRFENCRAITPSAFSAGLPASRSYRGFQLLNNWEQSWINCRVEFWHTIGASNTPAAGFWKAFKVDVDEIVTTALLSANLTVNGTTVDTRQLTGVSAATSDVFTSTGHWLVTAEPIVLEFGSGFGGVTAGTTYFAGNIAANTFTLHTSAANASAGTPTVDVTSTGSSAVVRKARVYTLAYEEDPLTAGSESRLTGVRQGISFRAPSEVATQGAEIVRTLPSGSFTTISASGAALFADGTASAPSIGWTSDADGSGTGLYRRSANQIGIAINGVEEGFFYSSGFNLSSGNTVAFAQDAVLGRDATSSLRIGLPASATPLANTLTIGESSRAGTDTNVGGANGMIASGTGTGTGAVSSLIFQTPTVAGAGTGAQTLATRLTLNSSGSTFATGSLFLSAGQLDVTPAGANAGLILRGTTPLVLFNGYYRFHALTDGVMRMMNDGATAGVALDVGTDGTLKVRNKTNAADGNLTAGAGTFSGKLATSPQTTTLGVGATTVAVTANMLILTGDAGANTLGTITGGVAGMELTILFRDALVTITDTDANTTDTVDLAGASVNFTSSARDTLTIIYDGTKWFQTASSVN